MRGHDMMFDDVKEDDDAFDGDDAEEERFYDDYEPSVRAVQPDEFVCDRCFLVAHRSSGDGVTCSECLDG